MKDAIKAALDRLEMITSARIDKEKVAAARVELADRDRREALKDKALEDTENALCGIDLVKSPLGETEAVLDIIVERIRAARKPAK